MHQDTQPEEGERISWFDKNNYNDLKKIVLPFG